MHKEQRELIRALLLILGACSVLVYGLLITGCYRQLTFTEAAALLQTICMWCGVVALLSFLLGSHQHQ
jgi:hypothetical protein